MRRRTIANAALVAAVLLCGVLLLDPPQHAAFYPACPIHQYLGILCPGCGATRALAALLHGHWVEALRLNALFVVTLPALLAFAAAAYRRAIRPGPFCWPVPPEPAVYATLAAATLFTIARNIL